MLTSLLAPLRLPERVLEALEMLVESTRTLGPIHSELESVREQTEPLSELLPALDRLNEDLGARLDAVLGVVTALENEDSHLARAVGGLDESLGRRLDAVHWVVQSLESEDSHLNRAMGELSVHVEALREAVAPVDQRLTTIESSVNHLAGEVEAIHQTLGGVQEDIQRITGLRGERGVMERARDAITGKETGE